VGAVTYLIKKKLYPRGKLTMWEWLKGIPGSYSFNLKQQFQKIDHAKPPSAAETA
jgi:hypothetical protein